VDCEHRAEDRGLTLNMFDALSVSCRAEQGSLTTKRIEGHVLRWRLGITRRNSDWWLIVLQYECILERLPRSISEGMTFT
jgi:hypothetical protein